MYKTSMMCFPCQRIYFHLPKFLWHFRNEFIFASKTPNKDLILNDIWHYTFVWGSRTGLGKGLFGYSGFSTHKTLHVLPSNSHLASWLSSQIFSLVMNLISGFEFSQVCMLQEINEKIKFYILRHLYVTYHQ